MADNDYQCIGLEGCQLLEAALSEIFVHDKKCPAFNRPANNSMERRKGSDRRMVDRGILFPDAAKDRRANNSVAAHTYHESGIVNSCRICGGDFDNPIHRVPPDSTEQARAENLIEDWIAANPSLVGELEIQVVRDLNERIAAALDDLRAQECRYCDSKVLAVCAECFKKPKDRAARRGEECKRLMTERDEVRAQVWREAIEIVNGLNAGYYDHNGAKGFKARVINALEASKEKGK